MKLSDKLAAQADPAKKAATKKSTAKKSTSRSASTKKKTAPAASPKWADAKRTVRDAVLRDLVPRIAGAEALTGAPLEDAVALVVDRVIRAEEVKVSPAERRAFVHQVLSDILGYGPLDDLLDDPTVSEIMCNGFDQIFVERDGKIVETSTTFTDELQYRTIIEKIVQQVGRRVDESSPMVDARLPDGSRVNAIVPPIAVHGPVLTIRRFSEDPFTATDLIAFGTMSDDAAMLLEACVRGKLNILVSGGTGTGKTTLLNVLSAFIPADERIITIEDAAELQLQQPHVVTLEARPPNAEGRGEVVIRDLVRNALRMRPDRIVVGEVRGGEAMDMLQAMNTGHEGSLTTVHANGPRDALQRLEMLVLLGGLELPEKAIREQIAAAIDVIVQLKRMPDGSRKVTSIAEIHGMEDRTIVSQEIFTYEQKLDAKGKYSTVAVPTGLRPKFLERLKAQGVDVPATILRPPGGGAGVKPNRSPKASGGGGRKR